MLAYRHLFHAGNFADVFKHALLVQLLLGLQRKDKPFLVLDTHAGIGRYDLTHEWARKNEEFRQGIARVYGTRGAPDAFRSYLDAVIADNPGGALQSYPGSPRLVRRLLRPGDRLVATELNRKDCDALHALFARDRQVQVALMDGYQALKAFLPPKERRGLVFIDSSFDRSGEFDRLVSGLAEGHRRFATGIFAIWYPLMEPVAMRAFERNVAATGIRRILQLEITVRAAETGTGMHGCGMLVVNPPFGFDELSAPMLRWLAGALAEDETAASRVRWIAGE